MKGYYYRPPEEEPIFSTLCISGLDGDRRRRLEIFSPDPDGEYWIRVWTLNWSKCYGIEKSFKDMINFLKYFFTIQSKMSFEEITQFLQSYNTPAKIN